MKILPVMYPEEGRNADPGTFIGRFNDEKFIADFHIRKQLALQKFLDWEKPFRKPLRQCGRRNSLRN